MSQEHETKGFLRTVERLGNALPHPAMIFVILSLILIIISHFTAGTTVTYYDAMKEQDVTVEAVSLMNQEGLRYMFNHAVRNFTNFAPLGIVLVAMLGVGVSEHSGLIGTALKRLLHGAGGAYLSYLVVFAGIISNLASDAGYVVVIPLGMIIFANAGKHPIAGLAAAFAGVSAGFSANLIFGPTDAMLAGITNQALVSGGIDAQISAASNWYFLIASTFLLTLVGGYITNKFISPNLGQYEGEYKPDDRPLTDLELKGLKRAGIALIAVVVLMLLLMFPKNAPFRSVNATGEKTLEEFINNGLIPMVLVIFAIPGLVYGKTVGSIKNNKDFVGTMTKGMESMAGFLVLAFFAAQFVAYFGETKLGLILSVKGAEAIEATNLSGLPLILVFILVSAFLNLFIGSASAKWAIMAPIFLPMMARSGIAPEVTQIAYRIGDSTTNIITPLMNYFAMIVIFMQRYDKERGIGTLISTMLPYSISFLISWSALMTIWYKLGIPFGQ
ncbi:MAG: SLC13 family permease [Tissierellia bacterium]|nr:SLC13 family permease [Tissierellia bacterium]